MPSLVLVEESWEVLAPEKQRPSVLVMDHTETGEDHRRTSLSLSTHSSSNNSSILTCPLQLQQGQCPTDRPLIKLSVSLIDTLLFAHPFQFQIENDRSTTRREMRSQMERPSITVT
mmetsp:Transcript_34786/g.46160  ORF Transcript_34786/g.46160 Transcript_34786/m.46160 type:complete len:116 (-) Transcript_34786:1704-2051(-)